MRYFVMILALMLLPVCAQAGIGNVQNQRPQLAQPGTTGNNTAPAEGTGSQQTVKLPKAKLLNPNVAKLKQLEAQMKALDQKLDSINGLAEDQQLRIQQMQDHMAKMMALMSNLMQKMSETQNGIVQNMK